MKAEQLNKNGKGLDDELMVKIEVNAFNLPGIRFCDRDGSVRQPVYLGIQKGREIIDAVPADRETVTFYPEFRVRRFPDGRPNFLGSFAQGPTDDRFFYLSWSVKKDSGELEMFRRIKLRFASIDWNAVKKAAAANKPIRVNISLTDNCGGPLCATPPPANISWEME